MQSKCKYAVYVGGRHVIPELGASDEKHQPRTGIDLWGVGARTAMGIGQRVDLRLGLRLGDWAAESGATLQHGWPGAGEH